MIRSVLFVITLMCMCDVAFGHTRYKWMRGYKIGYGCHYKKCWSYCGLSWTSSSWCYIKPNKRANHRVSCRYSSDCGKYMKYNNPQCASTCFLF
ncbi:uncharacterized protein LOC130635723 isoform X2 [Hydractinia symbiolongicarpus]|nr:uncharacterized protein LOC130635723 isoform X2 [Hydractinia symbiolongicarpus]XP_057301154.1 uncharacterized protein LOC130635723 isoform X2 [Hydractinia symbiolongicarpus]